MPVLADHQIEALRCVTPTEPCEKRPGRISYGLSSYGLDIRLGYVFSVFRPYPPVVIDVKNFDDRMLERVDLTPGPGPEKPDHIVIPPHSFALAESVEEFDVPRDVICVVMGKSTYARVGLVLNTTPLEPSWRGRITLELSNTAPLPMKVYCGEGIGQVIFFRGETPCRVSYADKKGKYDRQAGLTTPLVDGDKTATHEVKPAPVPQPPPRDPNLPPLPAPEVADDMTEKTTCTGPDGAFYRWSVKRREWVCVARKEGK